MTLSGFSVNSKRLLNSFSRSQSNPLRSPCFRIKSNKIFILDTPLDFYSNIVNNIKKSENRIILCSLYLGTGEKERKIIEAIEQQLHDKPSLKVYFYFDKNRASRGENENENDTSISSVSTITASPNNIENNSSIEWKENIDSANSSIASKSSAKIEDETTHLLSTQIKNPKSSLSLLKPLLKQFYNRVFVVLYEPPIMRHHSLFLSRILPERINEALGVQHMKIYIFDDNVILSGANLSDWYFENRHDRWVIFNEQPELCDFYDRLCKRVMTIGSSYQMILINRDNKGNWNNDSNGNRVYYHYIEPKKLGTELTQLTNNFIDFENNHEIIPEGKWSSRWKIFKNTIFQENKFMNTIKHWWSLEIASKPLFDNEIRSQYDWNNNTNTNSNQEFSHIDIIIDQNNSLIDNQVNESENNNSNESFPQVPTYLFPTLQLGSFNINYDRSMTNHLLRSMEGFSKAFLSSAYFNFTSEYTSSVLNSKCNSIQVVTSSPRCNGFFGSQGSSRFIPNIYSLMERIFFNKIQESKRSNDIQILEYKRDDGWTYHAKGLWLLDQDKVPITMIGSSNFGQRSVDRDVESQVILITQDSQLQKDLHKEQLNIESQSQAIIDDKEFDHEDRKCSGFLAFLTRTIFKKFL